MIKKESRSFNISVEGMNCERLYFLHLAKLINESGSNKYNLKVNPKVASPMQYAKRIAARPSDSKNRKKLPYIHVQDIEDYDSEYHRKKFYAIIDEMRNAESEFGMSYILGYSNYTFELWMLLHVADMTHSVQDRHSYLAPINRWFNKNYSDIDEFKAEAEFQSILDDYVTLDSIKQAICRAERLVGMNQEEHKKKENYHGFTFYHENPDLSVHDVIQLIFDVCEVK